MYVFAIDVSAHFLLNRITGVNVGYLNCSLCWSSAQDLIGDSAATEFARSRDHVRVLVDVLTRVRDIAERLVSAANVYATDMHQLSRELR